MSEKGPIGRQVDAFRENRAEKTRVQDVDLARGMAEIEDVFRESARIDQERGIQIGTLAWKGALSGGISDVRKFELGADGEGQSLTSDQLLARADLKVKWGKEVAEHPEWWPNRGSLAEEAIATPADAPPEDQLAA